MDGSTESSIVLSIDASVFAASHEMDSSIPVVTQARVDSFAAQLKEDLESEVGIAIHFVDSGEIKKAHQVAEKKNRAYTGDKLSVRVIRTITATDKAAGDHSPMCCRSSVRR